MTNMRQALSALCAIDSPWRDWLTSVSLSKLKQFRRVATRYDKLATNFLAMVQLASIRLWLRAYESTA
jgi:transposase